MHMCITHHLSIAFLHFVYPDSPEHWSLPHEIFMPSDKGRPYQTKAPAPLDPVPVASV